ncbi:Ribosome-associated complex subunit SSZ1 [Verticillium dahliae VDG2]|nr:Ribosome-associated complex subunit SSZ1 [Verticillium dahliae VDG2]
MPARVPTEADFAHLASSPAVKIALTWPKPAELTTSFLIVFHGLGDHEIPYAGFAEGVNLPGVLSIAPGRNFHWGDDIKIDDATGEIDPDPGYEKAETIVRDRLIKETLIDKLGWSLGDIMFFGFGQGGARGKAKTKVLALQFELDEIEELKAEFENVEVAHWRRKGVSMPREKEEMVPIMKFFADCLNDGVTGVGGPSV